MRLQQLPFRKCGFLGQKIDHSYRLQTPLFCSTWRTPTTRTPQIIQIFTRPHGSSSNTQRKKVQDKTQLNDILDRLKASAFSQKNGNEEDFYEDEDEYYYDDYSRSVEEKRSPSAKTTPPPTRKAAQYIPYFNRPYNRARDSGKMKNAFITRSYAQAPLSKYYRRRRRRRHASSQEQT